MLENEKFSYLKTLMYIAFCDGILDENELNLFVDIGKASGLSNDELLEIKNDVLNRSESLEDILSGITKEDTKTELLCDLLTLCYVDGEYSALEQLGLHTICELLSVNEDVLIELEKEAEEQIKKDKNPFNLFKKGKSGGKIINLFKQTATHSKNGAKWVGGKMKKGGDKVARSVTFGLGVVGNKISTSIESTKKLKAENKALREKLKTNTVSETVKQKVIMQLNAKISTLSAQLKAEKERNRKNEEMIELLQAQLDDLMTTMEVAQNAKTA